MFTAWRDIFIAFRKERVSVSKINGRVKVSVFLEEFTFIPTLVPPAITTTIKSCVLKCGRLQCSHHVIKPSWVKFEIAWGVCKEIALFSFLLQVFTHWSTMLEFAFVASSNGRRGTTSSNRSKSTFWEPWGSLDTAFLCSKQFKVRKHLMAALKGEVFSAM